MRTRNRLVPALFATALLTGCQHVAPAPPPALLAPAPANLRSPWDGAAVSFTAAPYTCGPAVPVGPDLTITHPLERNGHTDAVNSAVYSESSSAVRDLRLNVMQAADTYLRTGSRAAAQCAGDLLATAAHGGAMTGYMADREAVKEQNRALRSLAISWLKVRGAGVATPIQTTVIVDWMVTLARAERDLYEHDKCLPNNCALHNRLGHGAAMAAAAVGVAANDQSLFRWALDQYHSAIGDIDGRGMLTYDTRGQYALDWNIESAAALVQIAELGEANGIPMYGYDNGRIHLLVHTVALGLVSPDQYRVATGAAQDIPKPMQPWEVSWAAVYARRFPDPVVASLLQEAAPGGEDMWGGVPSESAR